MTPSLKKEIPLLLIIVIPFIYLATIWSELPAEVPIHWNASGEIDGYGSKMTLILIPFLLPVLSYILFLLIPIIDPKKQLSMMGKKYQNLKFILITLLSLLATYIIYSSKTSTITHPNTLVIGFGALFLVLGNYFKTIKPNYFVGIRTPWTLENEEVWKSTHKMAGKLWFIAGIVLIVSSLILSEELNFKFFITISIVVSIIPIIHSYLKFRSFKQ